MPPHGMVARHADLAVNQKNRHNARLLVSHCCDERVVSGFASSTRNRAWKFVFKTRIGGKKLSERVAAMIAFK